MIIIFSTKKRILAYFTIITFFVSSFCIVKSFNRRSITVSSSPKYIAVIIDDFGNNSEGTEEMLSLPIKFTGAVMPSMPDTLSECELLHRAHKAVILHQPMEPRKGNPSWLGTSPILNSHTPSEASEILLTNLSQMKYCVGVNNHMGSKVTENNILMNEIFSVLKEKNLPYIDSMTTPDSVTEKFAKIYGVTLVKRDIFLDSTQNTSKIEQNILKAGNIALKKGYCVAIGHVGGEGGIPTYTALNSTYKKLQSKNIQFVTIPELIEILSQSENYCNTLEN